MDPMSMMLIFLHLVLLPIVFHLLKYVRLDEMFKQGTPPQIIVLLYLILSLAITQLVINYFANVFDLIHNVA